MLYKCQTGHMCLHLMINIQIAADSTDPTLIKKASNGLLR